MTQAAMLLAQTGTKLYVLTGLPVLYSSMRMNAMGVGYALTLVLLIHRGSSLMLVRKSLSSAIYVRAEKRDPSVSSIAHFKP
jgi:hypothetical protein